MEHPLSGLEAGKWLFIGGAGYIGAHVLREFESAGAECFVLDNLSTGMESRIPQGATFIRGDASISAEIVEVCNRFQISGIVHLAAYMQARESVRNPTKFWKNNLGATLGLAESLTKTEVQHIIFSSSCSVYGNVRAATTESPLRPQSPYAFTKVASEQILTQACEENNVHLSILRYFNVIGCGEFNSAFDQSSETVLSASAKNILAGKSPMIFGGNFSTPDGTAMRDYVDVRDLARAHKLVTSSDHTLERQVFNVSSGTPTSVMTILNLLLKISGSPLEPEVVSAKEGDPAEVWATPSAELCEMGWSPEYEVEASIRDFWNSSLANNPLTFPANGR